MVSSFQTSIAVTFDIVKDIVVGAEPENENSQTEKV